MRKPLFSPLRHDAQRDTAWVGKGGGAGLWGILIGLAAIAGMVVFLLR